jgi:PTH1 family peptidyl-tRNA hydrolase
MKLIVGLGNPGAKHARNRHNVGFLAVDAIAAAHDFQPWRAKFQGRVAEGRLGSEKVVLLKPETYMNVSGDSVRAAVAFHKLDPGDVIVLHDELDLSPGRVRAKRGGGAAGHNGVRSIAAHIGPEFVRVRIGIGHPGDRRVVSNHVLNDFAKADADWLDPLLAAIARAAPELAGGDLARFTGSLAADAAPGPAAAARPAAPPTAAPPTPAPPADADEPGRGPLQRLIDRFR